MKTQLSKPARHKARYTDEYKEQALELWRASGRSAAKLGIRPPLLYRWGRKGVGENPDEECVSITRQGREGKRRTSRSTIPLASAVTTPRSSPPNSTGPSTGIFF